MNRILPVLLLSVLLPSRLLAQFPVRVQVNVVQPVPPYLPQIKADIAGNRTGLLNQDISSHLSIILSYTGRAQQHIKLAGSIERVAPTPMGVALRPDFQPAQPIIMGPQQTILSLTKDMLQSAFGNFSENSLVYNNMDLNTLRQNGIDYKLPEGTYRVCVTAYDYDRPGFSAPLSAPGTGCAFFTICYTASAPQLILPVSTMLQSNSGFQDFVPHSPQVQFIWTPPATTCGSPVGALNYDLEIRRVFEGQTITDAQSNPYVFHQQNIPTTTFLLDTLKYSHVLVSGQKYTVRVRANFIAMPGSPLEIANQGYSQIGGFTYAPVNNNPFNAVALNTPDFNTVPLPPGSTIIPGGYIVNAYSPGGSCPAAMPITNTNVLTSGITGADLTIAGFKMHITQANLNNDGSYKGTGYIVWHPFASDIELAVGFDTLKVNTDKVVYGGMATTAADITATGSNYDVIQQRITDGLHLLNQGLGSAPVNFPLGLNTALGGAPATLAIMGISFMPACTNMNVLFNVNLPDLGGWLSLAGSGFQIDPNKVLQLDKGGILFLPQDHSLGLPGMNFTFDGCPSAGDNSVDVSKGTYVQWDGVNGLGGITVNADLQFKGNSIVAVDKNDRRLTDPATIHANFSFTDWNDWTASVIPTTNLELNSLPGFMISPTGGFYDHSTRQNAAGMTFPPGYIGATDATWQGLYIKDLTLQLPSSLSGTNTASFGFHNFILDNNGVTTTISADNVLTLATGNLGGWAFSIDHIGIGVVQDNFQSGMQMTGGIKIPLSDDPLGYTCNLAAGEGTGISYSFVVAPKGNYNVKMWAASIGLQNNSSLTIDNSTGQFVINAKLNGSVTINTGDLGSDIPNVSITALSFQGMTITNHDPKNSGFGFDPGNWSFAGKGLSNMAKNDGPASPSAAYLAGGPSAFNLAPDASETVDASDPGTVTDPLSAAPQPADGGSSQSSADGFSINFTGFKPYVKFPASSEADIGVTFTMNAVLDESGLGIGGAATMDIFGKVTFPKGGTPVINPIPNFNLDSIGIDCNMDLMHVSGGLAFHRDDPTFGNDVKGHLDLTFLGTIEVDAAAIFGHTGGYNYWGLAATTFWPQGIMFPPGLSLNGLGGGFHYNMSMGSVSQQKITGQKDVSTPDAIINQLSPKQGTLGFDAQVILAYLGPNVICMQPTFSMDFSSSNGLEMMKFSGNAEILSSAPPAEGSGILNASMVATYTPNPQNFNCTIAVNGNMPVVQINVPIEFNVGDAGNYLYIGTPAPPGTDFNDHAGMGSMVTVSMGIDAAIVHANMTVYGYFDIGTQLPSSPYIPPAIQHSQGHDGGSMAQGVIDKFTNMLASLQTTNDNSHDVHGTVNNPGFMLGAGIHFDAGLDLVVVRADGSLDIGFAALLEHFNPAEVPSSCSADGSIGFNNWYAMAILYANLSADLSVGPFSVGSVNAGAVLTAGLINPTWGSGDIWINASALGVIDFSGSASISFGSECSIVKDPLDNIDMIGDFGPRGKNGESVDVTSTPFVIGNVPLNEDYTVMTNNNEMRTYQFRIDAYDVTSGSGTALGGAHQVSKGDYEVDIDHNEMLCGNATYNAHIRCSAYQTNGTDPNNPLVSQDTTFSFTTGPRPQVIQLQNLLYSYPIAGQRYLLKNEFGSQAKLVVAQDVSYLLHPGQPDDCSNPPAPPTGGNSGSPAASSGGTPATGTTRPGTILKTTINNNIAINHNIVFTQLLAKFFPSGGGDTLQTTFSYSYDQAASMGTLQFPLPSGLLNSKVYSMQIWVVPPPSSGNKASVNSSIVNKTLTQTVMTYSMNANGNLVATPVTKQLTETNTIKTLNGSRQMAATDSARVIFSMMFGTSQYNTFADKMAAYGSWSTQDETSFGFDMPMFSNASGTESFDEFEIKDFKSSCTVNGYSNPVIPHLLNADVPWDPNGHNDQDAGLTYVFAAGITALTHATVDLGVPETRGWFGVPMNQLMSMENMPYEPALSLYSNIQMKLNNTGLGNNAVYQIPSSGGSGQSSSGGNLPIAKSDVLFNFAVAGQPVSTPLPAPQGLLWKRDDYFYNDFTLLKDFVGDLSAKTNMITTQTVLDLGSACFSCTVEKVSGYYGSISMTADGWLGVISADQTNFWQDVNNFLAQPFTPFPPTARRTLHFTYNYPCANCTPPTVQASSSFSYKSLLLPQAIQGKVSTSASAPNNYLTPVTGQGKNPTPVPIQSNTVKTLLLKKYNIH